MTPAMEGAERYFGWIAEALGPWLDGRVLEVGSGFGVFATFLRKARPGCPLVVTDRDPRSVTILESRFAGAPEVDVRLLDVMDERSVDAVAKRELVDGVVSLNVLEHIEDDVQALANMSRLVRPGGRVVAFVPALEEIYGSLDRLAGHYRRYDRGLIAERMRQAGLRPVSLRFFNLIGALGWFVNACVLPRLRLDENGMNDQARIFDRYVVGLSSALERAMEPPFGQSLIAVGERT